MGSYTFDAVGTQSYSKNGVSFDALTPTVTHGAGNLLICYTTCRSSVDPPTCSVTSGGWTQLFGQAIVNNTIYIFARVATGTSTDNPTVQWAGTTTTPDTCAWIEAYSGDVYTDLGTIVMTSNTESAAGSDVLVLPGLTLSSPTNDNCLLIACSLVQKSSTSDDASAASPANSPETIHVRKFYTEPGSAAMHMATASIQQTTATSYGGFDLVRNGTSDPMNSSGVILALRSSDGADSLQLLGIG